MGEAWWKLPLLYLVTLVYVTKPPGITKLDQNDLDTVTGKRRKQQEGFGKVLGSYQQTSKIAVGNFFVPAELGPMPLTGGVAFSTICTAFLPTPWLLNRISQSVSSQCFLEDHNRTTQDTLLLVSQSTTYFRTRNETAFLLVALLLVLFATLLYFYVQLALLKPVIVCDGAGGIQIPSN